ncbi:hypothetical protein JVT61DRAFT_2892 [Boletus reticuloceps]|uniref:Uncharacterized protein n=1 Tax=Boletus reticuloceps TaxID=495285 RepID=A0A8I2YRB7_9AGAM|nr:hypothetical protein JVT61DRAFT_2892 [Boletus reticuloceps]
MENVEEDVDLPVVERVAGRGFHFHALVKWGETYKSGDVTVFDIIDGDNFHHPHIKNIHPGRANIASVWRYCSKDGDTTGDLVIEANGNAANAKANEVWKDAMGAHVTD